MDSSLISEMISISNFKIPINVSNETKDNIYENLNSYNFYEHKKENKLNKNSSFKDEIYSIKNKVPLHWKTEEELIKRITSIVNKISKKHIGMDICEGYNKFNTRKIAKLIVSKRTQEISRAKYSKKAKHIEFFIDTSMSMNEYKNAISEAIKCLERDGFICYLRGCGNGFSNKDLTNDSYNVRYTLESIGAGIVPSICRPTEETASKLANKAEFSIIISDFDGLSSIVRMSKLCSKDKIPYFLSTENRYSWRNTTSHIWVDKENSTYDLSKVFEIAKKKRI